MTGRFEIMDVDALTTSDKPGFPSELQPRSRARAGSKQQIEDIARKFNPELATRRASSTVRCIRGLEAMIPSGSSTSGATRTNAFSVRCIED